MAKGIVWRDPDMLFRFLPKEIIKDKNETELIVRLINGSMIELKGADTPDSLRGANPRGVILDEYGDMKTDVWDAVIRPVLEANNGWAIFIGTPKGKNHFYKLFRNGKDGIADWESFYLSAHDSTIFTTDQLSKIRSETLEHLYLQEYECHWHEDAGTVFRRIKENATSTRKEPERGHLYYIGVDLGRLMDWTVISVVDRNTHEQVYLDRFNEIEWKLQEARIEAITRRYNNGRIILDRSSVGDPIEEALVRKGLSVEGFTYTSQTKKDLIEKLALQLEADKIKILDEPVQIDELQKFTYDYNPSTRRVRYTAPEGEHDDVVNALALSTYNLTDYPLGIPTITQEEYIPDKY